MTESSDRREHVLYLIETEAHMYGGEAILLREFVKFVDIATLDAWVEHVELGKDRDDEDEED